MLYEEQHLKESKDKMTNEERQLLVIEFIDDEDPRIFSSNDGWAWNLQMTYVHVFREEQENTIIRKFFFPMHRIKEIMWRSQWEDSFITDDIDR